MNSTKMKTKKYDAVIFDLDGTLLDTLEDLKTSVNYALEKFQMPLRTLEEIRHFVGNGVQRLIELSVPDGTEREKTEHVFIVTTKPGSMMEFLNF